MPSLPKTRLHLQFLVAILSLSIFALLGIPRVEAVEVNANKVQIQTVDTHCTATPGTARGNPAGNGVWSSWATDQDNWDPDCVRVWIDNTLGDGKDVRFCIQTSDISPGSNLSNVACTPWASQGGGWSSWAKDPDAWAYDSIRIRIDVQDLPGRYISNYRLGVQNSMADGDNCASGIGTSMYTPGMNGGGGWSGWAPDANNEGSIACTRINLDNVSIQGLPCNINGNIVGSGGGITAYAAPSVPYGSSCASEYRTCTNGAASGSYGYNSCSVSAAANCPFNGTTVLNGNSVTAYAAPSVPYGSSCSSQTRTCSNGSLSGSYGYNSCSVSAAANCPFNGTTVLNGKSVTAYAVNTVSYGASCSGEAQTRTCNNGVLSGSYKYGSCSVAAPNNCTLNGVTVPHGTSHTFYDRTPLPYGTVCGAGNSAYAQSRTCTNGTLSGNGSFVYSSCTIDEEALQPVTLTGNGLTGSVTVRSGSFVKLAWNGVNADSCSLSGTGGFVSTSTPTLPMVNGAVNSSTWVQVNEKTTFTITCSKASPASSSSQSATINMVPSTQEI